MFEGPTLLVAKIADARGVSVSRNIGCTFRRHPPCSMLPCSSSRLPATTHFFNRVLLLLCSRVRPSVSRHLDWVKVHYDVTLSYHALAVPAYTTDACRRFIDISTGSMALSRVLVRVYMHPSLGLLVSTASAFRHHGDTLRWPQ